MNVTYKPQNNTTLLKVAQQFGVSVADICKANSLNLSMNIPKNTEILIPYHHISSGGDWKFGYELPVEERNNNMEYFVGTFGMFLVGLIGYRFRG